VLLNRYSPTPYHYATPKPKVYHLPPVKCPVLHHLPQSNASSWSLSRLDEAHTKLPIHVLAAFSYLAAGYRNGDHCEIRYSILVWALTKGQITGRGRLTGVGDGAHLTGGKLPTFGVA